MSTITINGETQQYTTQNLGAWLSQRGIAANAGGVAVALNGRVVRREDWSKITPQPGDAVEIVTAVSGG